MECEMKVQNEKTQNMKNKYEEQIEIHMTTIDEQEMQLENLKKSILEQS